jgi:hypothetical protein
VITNGGRLAAKIVVEAVYVNMEGVEDKVKNVAEAVSVITED